MELEVKEVKTEPECMNIRSSKTKGISYKDTTVYLSILCATLINAILILTGFWQAETWCQWAVVSAGTIFGVSYILVSASNMLARAKKKSH